MNRVADAGHDNLGGITIVVKNGANFLDDPHTILGNVIQAANKGGNISSTGLGSQQRLHRGEDQGDIGFNAFIGKGFGGFEPFWCHRYFYHNVFMDFDQFQRFLDHAGSIQRNNLGRNRTINNRNYFLDYLLEFTT